MCVVKIGTPEWTAWLASVESFSYRVDIIFFSVKAYGRSRGQRYWSAYKSIDGLTHRFYIGNDKNVTVAALEEIGAELDVLINHRGRI